MSAPVTRFPAGRESLRRYLRGLSTPDLERYAVALLTEYFCHYYDPAYMAEFIELYDECQRHEPAGTSYDPPSPDAGACWDESRPGMWLRCRRAARAAALVLTAGRRAAGRTPGAEVNQRDASTSTTR